MAKEKLNLDPSGLTWQEVIELDPVHIKGLSDKSLAKLTSRLVSTYNKRAKRLEQSGLAEASPSYRGLEKIGKTRLSVKGKTRNELVSTYADAKRLLTERSTFSVKGTKEMLAETEERLGHRFDSREQANEFWDVIDKLQEKGIGLKKGESSDIQKQVADMMVDQGMSADEVLAHFKVVAESFTPNIQFETISIFEGEEYEEGEDDE